jgi:hypothetical protein
METLKKQLEEYAKERADEVYDVDIHELRQLVIDGAKWAINRLTEVYDVEPSADLLELQQHMNKGK